MPTAHSSTQTAAYRQPSTHSRGAISAANVSATGACRWKASTAASKSRPCAHGQQKEAVVSSTEASTPHASGNFGHSRHSTLLSTRIEVLCVAVAADCGAAPPPCSSCASARMRRCSSCNTRQPSQHPMPLGNSRASTSRASDSVSAPALCALSTACGPSVCVCAPAPAIRGDVHSTLSHDVHATGMPIGPRTNSKMVKKAPPRATALASTGTSTSIAAPLAWRALRLLQSVVPPMSRAVMPLCLVPCNYVLPWMIGIATTFTSVSELKLCRCMYVCVCV